MSVFFAMTGSGEPAFHLRRTRAPEGAVSIDDARHRELLDALAEGKAVEAAENGQPVIRERVVDVAARRAELASGIRREARRRILTISPEWRQMNDLRAPSDEGHVRFARIDAVRAASELIEAEMQEAAPTDLADFPLRTHPLWPEID